MHGVYFEIDNLAFLLAVTFSFLMAFLYRWSKRFLVPTLYFSTFRQLKNSSKGWRWRWRFFSHHLECLALFFFLTAFVDPHFFLSKKEGIGGTLKPLPTEGIAIYLLLDQSGSMAEEVIVSGEGGRRKISKIELLKEVTRQFIQGDSSKNLKGRPDDLIGVVEFARGTHILSPLTLDHQAILDRLNKFNVVSDPDQDGTAIGYAIFKTANLIAATRHYAEMLAGKKKPAYDIKNSIMILVTDGFQDPNPLDKGKRLRNIDLDEAAEYAKKQGVKLYIVNIEPNMASEEFAPHRRFMQRVSQLTGGNFYLVENPAKLAEVYVDIDRLEKSYLPQQEFTQTDISKDQRPDLYERVSLYPYLITAGLFCLLLSIGICTLALRQVP